MLHHVNNYQHVSIACAIIIGVSLQEYKEYNNLPQVISGTTHFNKCFNIEYFNLHTFLGWTFQPRTNMAASPPPGMKARKSVVASVPGEGG